MPGKDKKNTKQDELTSGADGGQETVLLEGRTQQNEVVESGPPAAKQEEEGIGDVDVMVNPERGATSVEFPALDEEGNLTVEAFDAGKKHTVTSELAERKDANGVAYFVKL